MKKRAKQLAMLGLTVTMMCGTQMTAFASGLGEEAPVAIETEAKATANEETEEVKVEAKEEKADAKEEVKTEVKEEVVTGTEVAETPVVEETEVKETVAGTEELVGLGVSTEAETETDADTDAVPTPAPQADVEATTDTNTEAEVETEAEDKEVTAPTVNYTSNMSVFDATKAQDIVLTFSLDYDGKVTGFEGDVLTVNGKIIGYIDEQISDKEIRFTLDGKSVADRCKVLNLKDGDTLTFNTNVWGFVYADGNGDEKVASFPQVTLTYSTGDTGNGGGTVTPEPEKPQPEPEKPNPDGGNGGTETPDPEKDGWIKTDEGWKYYENGQKVTGWKAVSEKWYYFNENGIMETGWASVSGHWYYLNADGSMATGWVSVGGHWYYLNTDGSMASSQWIDGWYVDASGKML